jgi:hypothetical protein
MPEKTRYFKVACRYFSYLPIFDARDLVEIVQKLGCKPVAKLPPPEFGAKMGMAGYIAEKDRKLVYVDTDKQILRVVSFDFVDLFGSLNMLDLIVNEIKIRYDLLPDFYELTWELLIETGRNTLETFRKLSQKVSLLNDVNSKLNLDLALFGVRLFNGVPNSADWFDIKVEPNLSKNGLEYHVGIVYRTKKWDEFSKRALEMPEVYKRLIEYVEIE